MGGYLDGGDGSPASPGVSTVKFPPPVQQTLIIEQSDITEAAAAVSPAVVTITRARRPSVIPSRPAPPGSAPGVIYDQAGWILTNRHVVCGADALIVRLADGRQLHGPDVRHRHPHGPRHRACRCAGPCRSATIGDSAGTQAGSAVAGHRQLPGYPDDERHQRRRQRPRAATSWWTTPAARASSGHCATSSRPTPPSIPATPVARSSMRAGDVIGINTAVAGGAQGIGFAIPINIAKPIMQQAIDGKPLTRPWIGITFIPLNAGVAQEQGLPIDHGVLVQGVGGRHAARASSPAAPQRRPASGRATSSRPSTTSASTRRIPSTTSSPSIDRRVTTHWSISVLRGRHPHRADPRTSVRVPPNRSRRCRLAEPDGSADCAGSPPGRSRGRRRWARRACAPGP